MRLTSQIERLRTRKGIGLLELMLALAIISTLIIMATRYYQSVARSQKIAAAVIQVNSMVAAVNRWRQGQNLATATFPSITTLVSLGLLPKEWGDGSGINPWGGGILLYPYPAETWMYFTGVDDKDCNAFAAILGQESASNISAGNWGGGWCVVVYRETKF